MFPAFRILDYTDPFLMPRPRLRGVQVTIDDARKSFGTNNVLQGIDLRIETGEFLAILGRSGSGKSTLLRLLAGLEDPTAGGMVFGVGATTPKEFTRIMFQEPRLLPWATVMENVMVGVAPGTSHAAGYASALNALQEVGLVNRAHEWPAVLSGGQRQRVALARALVSHPRLLALDEPLSALDALTRIEMQRLLETVWKEQGFTAVLVTHDVSEALALADRVVMIEDGRIAMEVKVDLPRPRVRGSEELARLEGRLLGRLMKSPKG